MMEDHEQSRSEYQKTYILVSDLTVAGFMTLDKMLYISVTFLLWCSEDGRLCLKVSENL